MTNAERASRRVWLFCIAATLFLPAACTTHQPVSVPTVATNDSVPMGIVRVTKADGTTIHLEAAFIRGDSITGTIDGASGAPTGVPLDSVQSIEQKRLDVVRTVMTTIQYAGAIAIVAGLLQWL